MNDPQRAWAYVAPQPLQTSPTGPLAGLRFSIKDLYGVDGWPLTGSTRAPLPDVAQSVLVSRLLDLGAAAVGKTHLHEVALGITGMNGYGGTTHPTMPERVAGGSSSGAAVSVALGQVGPLQVHFALGTDTGGSIRVPAAWCGVVGYKPTKGHPDWSTQGVLPLSWTCDHTGPLARDVKTVVRVQEALTGQTVTPQVWNGLRVGLWLPDGWTDETVREAVLAFADDLKGRGATVENVPFPEVLDAYSPIVLSEAARVHAEALGLENPEFMPFTLMSLRNGAGLTEAEVQAAFEKRAEYRALLDGIFTAYDLILAPAVPTPPPLIGQEEVEIGEGNIPLRRAVLRITAPFSLLGAPTLAYPTHTPFVGVQLVAPHGQDDWLLGLGLALENFALEQA
ncbi:2-amino-5-chloromuconic acid deaminase [Deinococcus xinjiangensis]|uniref:2-amino-5-chloromuconic acid deaminase n=1 Tax=Deinococcus xinjiangensis TaxID=457454 RepID=A0ABP9VE49_9DEIO